MSKAEIFSLFTVPRKTAVIEVIDAEGVQYVAEAPMFSDATAAVWHCSRFELLPAGGRRLRHARGLHAVGNDGQGLLGLTYE